MKIEKIIKLMGNNLSLCFFVDENNTFKADEVIIWFEDMEGKGVDIGDNYIYFDNYVSNKKEIKQSLKNIFPNEKGLYKEIKALVDKMNEHKKL